MKWTVTHIVASVCLVLICSALLLGQDFMYWEANYDPITLLNITMQGDISEGDAQVKLFISGDAEISADNTAAAKLTEPGGGSLITEYKLRFDGNGTNKTGGSNVQYTSYDSFLSTPVHVTHVLNDDDVKIKLSVKVSNYAGEVANAGTYTATQTLTVTWVGP